MDSYKGVLFDLDGTLVDSLIDIADSMNKVLKEKQLPIYDYDSYRYKVGNGLMKMVERAMPENSSLEAIQTTHGDFLKEYATNLTNKTLLYPGISDLLNEIEARGIRIAVLSNKKHEFVVEVVTTLLKKWPIEVIRGDKGDVPRKPNPAGALLIAKEMNLEPSDFIYIGDTNVDMQTANEAGMFPVGVTWGFRSEAELKESGAMKILNYPTELFEYKFDDEDDSI